jgi:hypothetical protein
MDEMEPPQEWKEQIDAATKAVLERMTRAGWIQSAMNQKGFVIEWTESGKQAAKQFGALFDKLGRDMNPIEWIAFTGIIDDMSPGGIDPKENAID